MCKCVAQCVYYRLVISSSQPVSDGRSKPPSVSCPETDHVMCFRGGAEENARGVQRGIAPSGAGEGALPMHRPGTEDQ